MIETVWSYELRSMIESVKKSETKQFEGIKRIKRRSKLTWVEVIRRNMIA